MANAIEVKNFSSNEEKQIRSFLASPTVGTFLGFGGVPVPNLMVQYEDGGRFWLFASPGKVEVSEDGQCMIRVNRHRENRTIKDMLHLIAMGIAENCRRRFSGEQCQIWTEALSQNAPIREAEEVFLKKAGMEYPGQMFREAAAHMMTRPDAKGWDVDTVKEILASKD